MARDQKAEGTLCEARLNEEAARVLRRLCEQGAVLAVAQDMDKAVVVRDTASGTSTRTAVVDSNVAGAMALKSWIACNKPGRISRYVITGAGRTALAGMTGPGEAALSGFSDARAAFSGADEAAPEDLPEDMPEDVPTRLQRSRGLAAETPLIALSRRRDKSGDRFLSEDLVRAGERLREDFELAHIGPGAVTMDWTRMLTGRTDGGRHGGARATGGYSAEGAKARVEAALDDLGPGLGDIALRCCCHLEGLERAEKRMGWSARSGKIVLRIALQRLKRFYDGLGDEAGMIG